MSRVSYNTESNRRNYGDISQLTNWILDSGETCQMTPDISDFIPVSLAETHEYIKFAYGHFITAKQIEKVQIKISDDNGKPFIATLYNVLLAPDLCD